MTGVVFVLLGEHGMLGMRKGVQMAAYAALLHMPEGSD